MINIWEGMTSSFSSNSLQGFLRAAPILHGTMQLHHGLASITAVQAPQVARQVLPSARTVCLMNFAMAVIALIVTVFACRVLRHSFSKNHPSLGCF